MKTTTLTIRLSADDKQLLQTTARGCGLTVTQYLLQLLHADAGPTAEIPCTIEDLRAELAQYKADLEDLRAQVTALASPMEELRDFTFEEIAALAPPQEKHQQDYEPGECPKREPSE